ncbi:MAG TPA: ABC transporter substrate-binding protein [Methylomirabilota bacterium]|nr:ABC transporter substrate-binding protein [Methylomirabilota bacterium]
MNRWRKGFILTAISVGLVASQIRVVCAERIIYAYPSPSTSFLPLVVAQKKGFFESENLQPELVQIRPAVAIPGLTIGSVDYTTVLGSPIAARMRGIPLVITEVFADKPMDFLIGAKGIASAKELKNKIVGISAFGTATHFMTAKVLRAIGLDPDKDVTLRAVGDEGLRLQALGTGLIQASLLGSQGVIQGEKEGLKVIVAAADVIESLPFAGVTSTVTKLRENPQQVKKVLRAGLRGLRYVQSNKPGTVDVIQSWYRVNHEIATATYELARKSYSANGEVSEKGILLSMEFARTGGKFEKEISPSEIVDFNLLREVRKELGGS